MYIKDYKPKDQFQKEYQSLFSKSQIEWIIRQRENNGLNESGALMKISNRWYIHTDKFTQWFISHQA
ncbi:MAG: hypothetical protein HOK72_06695 [Flavobacteriales bacterium]|jgi:hypothetical protein|nr:hypothetical protein [Flavobacteriales bacterium]